MFRFQKLDVWRKATSLASLVYEVTRRFPESERFGLVSQMRRAAVSVAANIAEGSGRTSRRDFARFLDVAYGSLMEMVSHASIAADQQFIPPEEFDRIIIGADEVARMLSGLCASLETPRAAER
jgi:four helix bundle protein